MITRSRTLFWIAFATVAFLGTSLSVSPSSAEAPQGDLNVRPIDDWLSTQGTFAGFPNFVNWVNNDGDLIVRVDYAGLLNGFVEDRTGGAISFGTETSGFVTEQPLEDGRTKVKVSLHTKNALTFVRAQTAPGRPFLFGQPAPAILAGANATLGDSLLDIAYITPNAPGAPLDDFFRMIVLPDPDEEFLQVMFNARADGELRAAFGVPEGTPGRVTVTEKGISGNPILNVDDAVWPVAHIILKAVGQ